MPRTLISLGANLGNVRESMRAAKRLLVDSFGENNLRFSHLYRTPPIGGPGGQGDFLNAVTAIETTRSVWEVWETIKAIETALGRQRQYRWEARRIDIDLLLYDQQRIWTPHLKVPHPRMCMRTFVISPASEIVPEWIEPVTGWTISTLEKHLEHSQHNGSVIRAICQDQEQMMRLRREFSSIAFPDQYQVVWETAKPDQIAMTGLTHSRLTVAAVASPDPTTILWEDFSKPWVHALNMETRLDSDTHEPRTIQGPRYLMPADDTKWAVHEIISADQAMRCSLEAVAEL